MGIENRHQFTGVFPNRPVEILDTVNRLRPASPNVQNARNLVLWANDQGHLHNLTEIQRPIVEARYLGREGIVLSFKLVQERLGVDVTRSALHFAHRNGIEKLARIKRGEPVRKTRRPRGSREEQLSPV